MARKAKLILFYICKALEVVIAACCIGTIFEPTRDIGAIDIVWACVWMVAFACVIFVSLTMIISQATEGGIPIIAVMIFLFTNAVLNCAAGGLVLKNYDDFTSATINLWSKKYMRMMLACGILAIANCLILFVDLGLTIFLP